MSTTLEELLSMCVEVEKKRRYISYAYRRLKHRAEINSRDLAEEVHRVHPEMDVQELKETAGEYLQKRFHK